MAAIKRWFAAGLPGNTSLPSKRATTAQKPKPGKKYKDTPRARDTDNETTRQIHLHDICRNKIEIPIGIGIKAAACADHTASDKCRNLLTSCKHRSNGEFPRGAGQWRAGAGGVAFAFGRGHTRAGLPLVQAHPARHSSFPGVTLAPVCRVNLGHRVGVVGVMRRQMTPTPAAWVGAVL